MADLNHDNGHDKSMFEALNKIKHLARSFRAPVLGIDPDLSFAISICGEMAEYAVYRYIDKIKDQK